MKIENNPEKDEITGLSTVKRREARRDIPIPNLLPVADEGIANGK
jgi:hypothetical protein